MRAVVYHGQRDIRITDVPDPQVGPGQVALRIGYNGICGTDLHEYFAGPIFIPNGAAHPLTGRELPLTLGHEFSGTVVEVGSGVTSVTEGDRVAVEPLYTCGPVRPLRLRALQRVLVHRVPRPDVTTAAWPSTRSCRSRCCTSCRTRCRWSSARWSSRWPWPTTRRSSVRYARSTPPSCSAPDPIGIGLWHALRGMGLSRCTSSSRPRPAGPRSRGSARPRSTRRRSTCPPRSRTRPAAREPTPRTTPRACSRPSRRRWPRSAPGGR